MQALLRKKSRAIVIGPGGLGDQIWMSGAVRYIANQYSETHLVCTPSTHSTLVTLYRDTPSIKLHINMTSVDVLRKFVAAKYRNVYACAFTKDLYIRTVDINDLPGVFYDHMEIPRSVRHSHFSMPILPESALMYDLVKSQPYIFVHTMSSTVVTQIVSWDIHSILTIDPNVSHYPSDHPWCELSEKFVNKPFRHYYETIKHASELHLTNSSFYVFASQIAPLDAKVKLSYDRYSGEVMPQYDFS